MVIGKLDGNVTIQPIFTIMLKNYIKIAVRNLAKNKLFSVINILGLSVSMASCLLLFLYANKELSYDSHHGKDIYRITSTFSQLGEGDVMLSGTSSVPIGPAVAEEIPEIINSARITGAALFNMKDMITYDGNPYYIVPLLTLQFLKSLNMILLKVMPTTLCLTIMVLCWRNNGQ